MEARRLAPQSLQNRLLLSLLVCMTIVLLIAGVAIYRTIRTYLENEFDTALAERVSFYADTVYIGENQTAYFSWWNVELRRVAQRTNRDMVQIWYAATGKAIPMRSPSLRKTPGLPRMNLGDAVTERFDTYTIPWTQAPARLCTRIITARVRPEDEKKGVTPEPIQIIVGRDLAPLHALLRKTRLWFSLAGIALTTGMLLAARTLIRRGVRPVKVLAEKIEALPIAGTGERIALSHAPSELNPVVSRFNALMDRVDLAIEHERQFASNAAHELRNPLAAIRATVESTLSRSRQPSEYEDALDIVLQNQRGMQRVVDHLLLLARLESGHHESEFILEPMSITKVLKKGWRDCFDVVEERRLRATWLVEDPGPDITLCASLFEIVVRNLLDNAAQYTPVGGAITIRAKVDPEACRVTVENDNPGLTAEMQAQSFTPFWRAAPNASGHRGNAGIGLALCRRIATTLGGTLEGNLLADGAIVSYTISVPILKPLAP
jgi:two-component system, OmpR family, heavy metal sensor histidine kinase CusS